MADGRWIVPPLALIVAFASANESCNCKKTPPAPPVLEVSEVVFKDISSEELQGLVPDQKVREIAAGALAPGFSVAPLRGAPASAGAYRCELTLRTIALTGGGEVVLRSAASAECKSPTSEPDEPPLETSAVLERTLRRPDGGATKAPSGAVLAEHAQRAIKDVLGALAGQAQLRGGDASVLLAALGSSDAQRRRDAIRAAGERKLKQAVPVLIKLLKDPAEEVRDAALGALVSIGDEAAIKPLVAEVSFRDLDSMRKILDAVAQIGGAEAISYLEFVSEGHDDPEVRGLAKAALERARRKAAPQK
jgi:hypothetical protein